MFIGEGLNFIDRKLEFLSRKEIEKIQLKRLKWQINRAKKSRFWSKRLKGIEVKKLDDLEKIPFTDKEDLRRENMDFFAENIEKIVRIHMSSGSTGKPKVVGFTGNDLKLWAQLNARNLRIVGIRSKDIFVNTASHNLFTGGLGITQGAELLGACTVPLGPVGTKKTLEILERLEATALHAIPSFGVKLAENASLFDLELEKGIFGGETWSEQIRKRIERKLGIEAFDNYGLSELCGPGVAVECKEKTGLHVWEDAFILEVIDPKTGERVGEGEKGEIVLTSLWKEALPMIRFRTGDIAKFLGFDCACGRKHALISRIEGRSDDMLVFKGTNVFPSAVENVLAGFDGFTGEFQIIARGEPLNLKIIAEFRDTSEKMKEEIERRIREELFVRIPVELVSPGSIRSEGKARRVIKW